VDIKKLRTIVSMLLFCAHFFILILLAIFSLLGGYTTVEFTSAIAIILPMSGTHLYTIIRYTIKHKNQELNTAKSTSKVKLDFFYVFIAFVLPVLIIISLITAIVLKAIATISFESLKLAITIIELAVGGYLVSVIESLFTEENKKQ